MSAVSTSSDSEAATNRRLIRLEIELEECKTFDGFARLYAAIAVVAWFLLFLPILDDVTQRDGDSVYVTHYGTLWEMARDQSGDPAWFGIILAVCLVALSVYAAFLPRRLRPPIGVAIVSALVVLMLLLKPGTGEPVPDRAAAGNAGLALAIAAGCLAIIHAIHVSRDR